MNFNNYTIKSQEAVQQAQQLAQELQHSERTKPTRTSRKVEEEGHPELPPAQEEDMDEE